MGFSGQMVFITGAGHPCSDLQNDARGCGGWFATPSALRPGRRLVDGGWKSVGVAWSHINPVAPEIQVD